MERLNFFPQIFRKFAAKILKIDWRWLVLAFLTLFFLVNLGGVFWPKNSFERVKISILKAYQNPKSHLELAQIYLKNNDLKNAQKEVQIAEELLKRGGEEQEKRQVLGFGKKVENLLKDPGMLQKEITDWEKIKNDLPGYRDAYLQLAKLHWQLYQNDLAKEYLNKALELDPNFEPAKEFKKILGE